MKSLKAAHNILADAHQQIEILEYGQKGDFTFIPFHEKLRKANLLPLKPLKMEIFQINIGKMCNQTCKHCHVDAGPDRKEIMAKETMQQCLEVLKNNPQLKTVDLTGGAPEMNPEFRWFVEEIKNLNRHVIVRCNLTIILANKKYYDLPDFYKLHQVEVVCSLPFYRKDRTDSQRGNGVFQSSIKVLKLLNEVGYGQDGTGLILNLVYNAAGAFLPPCQSSLEKEYKKELQQFDIKFNHLFTITNMPISRYLDYLLASGNYETYMQKLVDSYNPAAAANVMCRNTISVGWDGYLYDCDFNQMLELKVNSKSKHISDFNLVYLQNRNITTGQHCFGCTAGAGSGCGGSIT